MQGLQSKKIATENVQYCPICNMPQQGIVNGTITEKNIMTVHEDKWYSFCNCNNIFFTDWDNMDQTVYDKDYQKKYSNPAGKEIVLKGVSEILDTIGDIGGIFAEIGVVTDYILDVAKDRGYTPVAMDINETTQTKYEFLKLNPDEDDFPKDISVLWVAHVFEHFKDPIKVANKMYNALNDDGYLYVAMPDPWFIPLQDPHKWAHWHCHEHHIMWDMDSFIDALEKIGFTNVSAQRITFGAEYRLVFKKVSA